MAQPLFGKSGQVLHAGDVAIRREEDGDHHWSSRAAVPGLVFKPEVVGIEKHSGRAVRVAGKQTKLSPHAPPKDGISTTVSFVLSVTGGFFGNRRRSVEAAGAELSRSTPEEEELPAGEDN
ncbi:unnamed protein product [Cuscuta europaea]|uniref:Uncharacterized protein n=1 Tax=Cuscuta europaea TaxID=41803 RepID=A0A9P0ZTF6_CUSEU|nr:unnamed protein product [Cuscuta europaea]